jgi:hypothetical protein
MTARLLVLPLAVVFVFVLFPIFFTPGRDSITGGLRGLTFAVAMIGWALFIGIINARWTQVLGGGTSLARSLLDTMSVWGGIALLTGALPVFIFVLWRPDKVLVSGPDKASFTTMSLAGSEQLESERNESSHRMYIGWVRVVTAVALLAVILELSL